MARASSLSTSQVEARVNPDGTVGSRLVPLPHAPVHQTCIRFGPVVVSDTAGVEVMPVPELTALLLEVTVSQGLPEVLAPVNLTANASTNTLDPSVTV